MSANLWGGHGILEQPARERAVIVEYMNKAIEHSSYKKLDDDSWFAEIPGFDGVWANAATVEACRKELLEVLEEWLLLKIHDGDEIPSIDGIQLRITKDSAASLLNEIPRQAGISDKEWESSSG